MRYQLLALDVDGTLLDPIGDLRPTGTMRWAEVAKTESSARRLMAKLGLAPHPPPTRPATPLGQLSLPLGK
jgi:hypothetical protein